MAYLDPKESFEHFRDKVLDGIRYQFPIEGRTKVLQLDDLEVKDDLHPDDIRGQHQAKVEGKSWAAPVVATITLRDKETGRVIDKSKMRVAELPKVTRRYSQIVSGREYQVDNQWQLKPGAYVRRRQSGELETRFQTAGRPSFDVTFDDASKIFKMEYHKAKLPLYPIMNAMGVSDDQLEKTWGKEILEANRGAKRSAGVLEQFYKSTKKEEPESKAKAVEHLRSMLEGSALKPDSTYLTLGKPISNITGEALTLATAKMLKVQAGHPEDDRDSLQFKDLRSVGDFAYDKMVAAKKTIHEKAGRKINIVDKVRDIVRFEMFDRPVRDTFHKNAASQLAKQINPVEMVSSAQQTTIMGPGGIQSEQSIMDEAKFVNPSHMGFLDPIHTPEGGKTGITLRLPMGLKKVGNEPMIPIYNLRTEQMELVGPNKFVQSKVVLPDQVRWVKNKPVPISDRVKIADLGNEIRESNFDDAQYVLRHPSQFFNATSNLIPFLGNSSGGRASMGTRHIEQAISLEGREAPLVQVSTPSVVKGLRTFEEVMGQQAAHHSPVKGTVKSIHKGSLVIKGEDGKDHEVQLYNNYPLNDAKSVLHSTSTVAVGDKVNAGDLVADSNFSRNGTLALGTNLRVAYIPYKGYNFEDGVVISESAANKLKSVHLYKKNVPVDADTVVDKSKFVVQHVGSFKNDQLSKLGDDGIVRVGQKVVPGDPLVLAMKKFQVRDRTGLAAIRKSLGGHHTDRSLTWDGETDGEVVGVHHKGKDIVVHVRTSEPMQVGDKISGRFGNKGIVTRIIPDDKMPKTSDGRHIEVALNPTGIPGRMNVSQALETAASKIADKTGKPYIVENFQPETDQLAKVKAELKAHGISDTEELTDPTTGHKLGKALVGKQYLLKLHHQVDKKVSARSGLMLPGATTPEKYDLNLQPSGGGHAGGQSMDPLGLYALLAHGAKANIREMMTWKAEGPDPQTNPAKRWQSQHNDVWDAIQHGDPLPAPKSTFAFHKFGEMLRAAGVNMEKKGHDFILTPLTDNQILAMTGPKALPKPAELLYSKIDTKTGDLKPKPGGLFDDNLTGGHGGRKWSRIDLAEPLPNPIFEKPIRRLTDLTEGQFTSLVGGEKGIDKEGNIVSLDKSIATGGNAIKKLLAKIDVDDELLASKKALAKAPASKVDTILKKVKYLSALKQAGMKADEAYVLHHLPVLPPALRPVTVMPDGNLNFADINQLYSLFAQDNMQLKDPSLAKNLTEERKGEIRKNLYDGLQAIMGTGVPYKDAKQKGLLHQIAGSQPKHGFFQSMLLSRKQDMSMRSTIVPDPSLGLDEVGLPREPALKLFAPFVVHELRWTGASKNVIDAQKEVQKGSPAAFRALEKVVEKHPVILKRDPVLHKYSIQGFKPKLVAGNAIQIHPLVTGGYNADFDGDTMSVFVPISEDAKKEAYDMMPSNNLFSEATGRVVYKPTLESALGLYKLSDVGTTASKGSFTHPADALEAVKSGRLQVTDPIKLSGKITTPGRILLSAALPEPMQSKMMHDMDFRFDSKGLNSILTEVAKEHTSDFGLVSNKLKNIGNGASSGAVPVEHANYVGPNRLDPKNGIWIPMDVHTLSLDDFTPDKKTREAVLSVARKNVDKINESTSIAAGDKERRAIEVWKAADREMKEVHLANAKPSNLLTMYKAGIKPGWDQYKQMVMAPMVIADSSGRELPTPVTKSYAEGLDVGGYWGQMPGARRGAVMKVQEVREPGALSKLLMAATMDMVVTGKDCGTSRGISLPVMESDIYDRYLSKEFKAKDLTVPEGTLLTPDLVAKMRSADKNAQVIVRSPLKCEHDKGVCQKCMGLAAKGQPHDIGENVGVQAAQTLSERAVQLTLKEFHTGGTVQTGGGAKVLGGFERFKQLTMLPKKIRNSTTLSTVNGTIEKIEKDPTGVKVWIGGKDHYVGRDPSGMPLYETLPGEKKTPDYISWEAPKVGLKVERGQPLSDPNRTFINPHTLYAATKSMESVQNHMAKEMYDIYKSEGVKRKQIETVVKAMSNLTKVKNPGDYEGVLRGEFHPHSRLAAINRELVKAGKTPIEHEPVLKGVDMLPLSLQEDWMAKLQHRNLERTVLDAAATYGRSSIHGLHPIPGMAYGAEFGISSSPTLKLKPEFKTVAGIPTFVY